MVAHEPSFEQLRARDESAIAALIDQHYAAIYRYLFRLVNDQRVAEDLTQDTFLDVFVSLPQLNNHTRLAAWMYRIATNNAHSYFRRARRFRWLPLDWRSSHSHSHEDRVADSDLVTQAMAALTDEQRSVLLLYAWQGFSCAEIGEMLGKRENAVKMALSRARRRFRDVYAALGGVVDPEVEL